MNVKFYNFKFGYFKRPVQCCRYDIASETFEKYQVLDDYGIVEWILLKTGEILLFLVDSIQSQVKVYQHKGVSGFVKIDAIKSFGE